MNFIAKTISILIALLIFSLGALALEVNDYLILNDIGDNKFITEVIDLITEKVKPIQGYSVVDNSGILIPTGHFDGDHVDKTYRTAYERDNPDMAIRVQVTQHAGAESDKWLLHEVERGFRSEDLEAQFEGTIKEIDGNRIFTFQFGTDYRWVSNNVIVYISYSDPQLSKPEPLEIVKAYLAKHPSTISLTDADMKSRAHNEKWIKDEMERRLWLCDKWFMQLQLEKAELKDVLGESVKHMEEFLNYREKYYGVSGEEEKGLLNTYLDQQNGTEIKNRLDNLKQWWTENKGNAITL